MMMWITANVANIIIVLMIAVLAALAFRHVYKNRGSCSCGCGGSSKTGCGGCSSCHPKPDDKH